MPGIGVRGPYQRGGSWVIYVRTISGDNGTSYSFTSKSAAEKRKKEEREGIEKVRAQQRQTLGDAISDYDRHLTAEGYKQRVETLRRLRSFFAGDLKVSLAGLTPKRCAAIYEEVTTRKASRWAGVGRRRKLVESGKPLSATSHRGMLTHAKTFLKWCVRQKWIPFNPLSEVEPKGKLKHGKPQLRIDEARAWMGKALEFAPKNPGAVAALCALLLGMRATEIISRQVRDLDDDGKLLWIPESKTPAGRRTLEVPDLLRPLLQELAKGKKGGDRLFGVGHLRGWPLFWVKKIARAAEVPEVNAHSMRGLHATLAMRAGATSGLVASALGHASDAVTLGSYAQQGSASVAQQREALKLLQGGKGKKGA